MLRPLNYVFPVLFLFVTITGSLLADDPLVARWRFHDLSPRLARDEAGANHGWYQNGVALGEPASPSDGSLASARFNGRDSFLRIPHTRSLQLSRGTIAFWMRADSVYELQGLFSKDANGFGSGGHLTISVDRGEVIARLQSDDESHQIRSNGIMDAQWAHVAFTFGSGGMKLYIHGKLKDSNPYQGGIAENREPLVIAASTMVSESERAAPLNDFYAGQLDDVTIHSVALTAEQVRSLQRVERPRYRSLNDGYASNDPIAWWRLDDPVDSTIAVDQVGSHHGQRHGVAGRAFDGRGHIDVGRLDVDAPQLTILACLKPRSFHVDDARILSKANGTNADEHYWMLSTCEAEGKIRLRFRLKADRRTVELVADEGELPLGRWSFAAAVYDGAEMRLYLDGKCVGSARQSGRVTVNAHCHAWIGDNPSGAGDRPFDGELQDVAVFDRALSE